MSDMTKSEMLSFFDANARELPDGLPILYDVYATPEGLVFKKTSKTTEELIGDSKPIPPVNIVGVELRDDDIYLQTSSNQEILLGNVNRSNVYLDPPFSGTGLRNSDGTHSPLVSDIPDLTIVERETDIQIQQTQPVNSRDEGYAEATYRYSGANATQAGTLSPPVVTWTKFGLTHVTDYDNIGISIVNGDLVMPAGVYRVEIQHTALRTNSMMARLFCVAQNSEAMRTAQFYQGMQGDGGVGAIGVGYGVGAFRLTESRTLQFQYYLNTRGGTAEVRYPWGLYLTALGSHVTPIKIAIWKCFDDGLSNLPTI